MGQKQALLLASIDGHLNAHSCFTRRGDNIGGYNQIFRHERVGKDDSHVHARSPDFSFRNQTWNDGVNRMDQIE